MKLASLIYLIGASAISGCASNPPPQQGLTDYIKNYNYVAFNLPRSKDGVGTVIDFKNQSESVVATGPECFLRAASSTVNNHDVGATALDQKVNWSAGASFSLPKAILEYADVSGIAKVSGAKSVKVSLNQPFEQFISRLQFAEFLNSLAPNDPCKSAFADPKNLIIYQVLGAKGISYEFLDGSDNTISLTAKILDQVDFKPEVTHTSQNNGKLETDQTLLIGYRTWVVTKPAGIAGTGLDVEEVSKKDVEQRRADSH